MPRTYQELRWYSGLHDCVVARVSMADDNHQELFMVLPDRGTRRQHRAARAAAVEALSEAIDEGCPPGEVTVDPKVWADLLAEHMQEQMA